VAKSLDKPQLDIDTANKELADAQPLEIIQWAARQFGDGLAMSSSFGAQSAVMLHLCTRVVPDIPVILLDTGYMFPETYQFIDELAEKLALNLKVYQSPISPARMEATTGKLWEGGVEGLEKYDQLRKVEPMARALRELKVTGCISGIRHDQTDFRATLQPLRVQDGIFRIHPILRWTTKQIHEYLVENDLPYHPLYYKGFKSIGDIHSTRAIKPGEDERAGRFYGLKSECGIHLPQSDDENTSRGCSGL